METVGNETLNDAPKPCCRACLDGDCKLFDIHEINLAAAFACISGIVVSRDHLPQHLCARCGGLIMKYMSFRTLCINSYTLFMSQLFKKEAQDSFTEHHKTFYNLSSTSVETINCIDASVDEIKQELAIDDADIDSVIDAVNFKLDPRDSNKVEVNDVMNTVLNNSQKTEEENVKETDIKGVVVGNKKDGKIKKRIAVKVKKNSEIETDDYFDDFDDDYYFNEDEQDSGDDRIDGTANKEVAAVKRKGEGKKRKIVKKKKVNTDDKGKTKDDKHKDLDDNNDLDVNDAKPKRKRKKKEVKRKFRTPENDYMPMFDFTTFENTYGAQVVTLSKEEQIAEIEERKSSSDFLLVCADCGKGFQMDAAYNNHRARHHPNAGPHACEICALRFQKRNARQAHQDLHRLKFTCLECGFVSRSRCQARAHYNFHSGKTFACQHCGKTFEKRSTYLSHVRLSHPAMNVSCDVCGETFVGVFGLRIHKYKMHKTTPQFSCPSCPATFLSSGALRRHTDTPHHAAAAPCERCGENCASETELQLHVAEKHKAETHRCEECDLTFPSLESYSLHHRRKHLNQRYSQAGWTKLPRRAPPQRRKAFVCEECGRVFNHLSIFRQHQHSHRAVRPFRCSHCPKTFSTNNLRKMHERCHTGEKPFQCERCPLSFSMKGNLVRHRKSVHLGIRPRVPCPVCARELSSPAMLRAHLDTQHRGLPGPKRVRKKKKKE